jgi:hypothetical protein
MNLRGRRHKLKYHFIKREFLWFILCNHIDAWAAICLSDGPDVPNSIVGTDYRTSNMVTYNWVECNKRQLVWNNIKYTLY